MIELTRLVAYLDEYLRTAEVRDDPRALNGLQVSNGGTVTRIAAAVDLCEATVRMAAESSADFLLVHHGLFWGGMRPLTGPQHRRITGLLRHDIALYGSHLPLDRHPEVGNAPVLARQLGVAIRGEFGIYEGQPVGVWGQLDVTRAALTRKVTEILGPAPRVMPFGPERTKRVGIITGAGGDSIREAAEAGLDTFITGEGPHWTFFDAEELGLNVLYAGHYATETVGVKALAEHVSGKFSIPWLFLDHPTGL